MKTCGVSIKFLMVMTFITGVLYPAAITGIARLAFHEKAAGSIITLDGKPSGATLIAQKFTMEKYFMPRPSASGYAAVPSGPSNMAITSAGLKELYDIRVKYWRELIAGHQRSKDGDAIIPPDMLFASGSGLDPHISPEAAMMQAPRVAAARGFSQERTQRLQELIANLTERPILRFVGEPVVNVLMLNIHVDKMR